MSLVGPLEMRKIMQECFSGEMSRDCQNCPAHPSNGGHCCYGRIEKFDDSDDECQACIHNTECQQQIFSTEAEAQHFEQEYGHSPPAAPRPTVRLPIIQPSVHQRISRAPASYATEEQLRPLLVKSAEGTYIRRKPTEQTGQLEPEGLFCRFVKDFLWGGFQGAFEMGLAFFRNRHLP